MDSIMFDRVFRVGRFHINIVVSRQWTKAEFLAFMLRRVPAAKREGE